MNFYLYGFLSGLAIPHHPLSNSYSLPNHLQSAPMPSSNLSISPYNTLTSRTLS